MALLILFVVKRWPSDDGVYFLPPLTMEVFAAPRTVTAEEIRSLADFSDVSHLLTDDQFQRADFLHQLRRKVVKAEREVRRLHEQLDRSQQRIRPLRNLYRICQWASESSSKKKFGSIPGPGLDLAAFTMLAVIGVANLLV